MNAGDGGEQGGKEENMHKRTQSHTNTHIDIYIYMYVNTVEANTTSLGFSEKKEIQKKSSTFFQRTH